MVLSMAACAPKEEGELADSPYKTTADLKGTQISAPNGIGASDYNITCLLLDADGIDPQKDVTLTQVSSDACVAAMEPRSGLISGTDFAIT